MTAIGWFVLACCAVAFILMLIGLFFSFEIPVRYYYGDNRRELRKIQNTKKLLDEIAS